MNKANKISLAILRSSIAWGLLASVGFFTLLHSGSVQKLPDGPAWEKFLLRYTAGHPIEYVETAMFFMGIAALILKAFDVAAQARLLCEPLLGAAHVEGAGADDPQSMLSRLDALSDALRETYLYRRVRGAIEHVVQTGSADALDEHLKYAADVDAGKANGSYAFIRILIWAIPIMGFLGTVVGITEAIANLSSDQLVESLPGVTAGLGVAFDTTAIALVFATIMMFGQFLVDRREGALLDGVEVRTAEELAGRFDVVGGGGDPQVAAVRRMADAVIKSTDQVVHRQSELWQHMADAVVKSTDQVVHRQTELWQRTINAAHERWNDLASASQQQIETALAAALDRSLQAHATHIEAAGRAAAERNEQHWAGLQQSLDRCTAAMLAQHQELATQGQVLLQVVESTGQVTRLEDTLNQNLAALAGSHNFEETVQSLAAVIHLLTARLGHQSVPAPHIGRAAETRGAHHAA